jgi:antitoxin (DNA-binding transcriptional repressor) of toxin-antitoxin stability system
VNLTMNTIINAKQLRDSLPEVVAKVRRGERFTVLYRSRAAFQLAVIYPNEHARVRSYFRRVIRRPRSTAPAEGETGPAAETTATASGTAAVAPALALSQANAGS